MKDRHMYTRSPLLIMIHSELSCGFQTNPQCGRETFEELGKRAVWCVPVSASIAPTRHQESESTCVWSRPWEQLALSEGVARQPLTDLSSPGSVRHSAPVRSPSKKNNPGSLSGGWERLWLWWFRVRRKRFGFFCLPTWGIALSAFLLFAVFQRQRGG